MLVRFIHLQMERMILKSMDHIVNVFGNSTTAPKLNFKLYFIGSKCMSTPSVSEVCDQYCSVLNLVSVTQLNYIFTRFFSLKIFLEYRNYSIQTFYGANFLRNNLI